jgi:tRNA(Ile2) C34 agmatinyltransferase TiaS
MTPLCPACDKPMTAHGRAFLCEPCRQIIIFFDVSDASPYTKAGKLS